MADRIAFTLRRGLSLGYFGLCSVDGFTRGGAMFSTPASAIVGMRRWLPFSLILLVSAGCRPGNDSNSATELTLLAERMPDGVGPDLPNCSHCELRIGSAFVIGPATGALELDGSGKLAINSKGEVAVVESYSKSAPIILYDTMGHPRLEFGRSGNGPGEFYSIKDIQFGSDDSLFAFQAGRLTIVDPDFGSAHSRRLPASFNALRFEVLPSGALLFNNYLPHRAAFALIASGDSDVRHFGPKLTPGPRPDSDDLQYLMAPVSDSLFWAVKQYYRFDISLWNTEGRKLLTINRRPEWFPSWSREDRERRGNATASQAPILPWVSDARVDASDRLWVVTLVPEEHFSQRESSSTQPSDHVDTVIDIYDARSGGHCASFRHDELITRILDHGIVYRDQELPDGSFTYELLRAGISNLPARGC